jgi:hypothetical protein
MVIGEEIVGFGARSADPQRDETAAMPTSRFELTVELQGVKRAEITRLNGLAERLLQQYDAVIACRFLYFEVLGRSASASECVDCVERLSRAPQAAAIIDELLSQPKPHECEDR